MSPEEFERLRRLGRIYPVPPDLAPHPPGREDLEALRKLGERAREPFFPKPSRSS